MPVVPSHEGPEPLKPLNPFKTNLAVTICQDENVKVVMADVKGKRRSVVAPAADAAWLRYFVFKGASDTLFAAYQFK